MSKRTPGLPRRERDNYPTPPEALQPAIDWIRKDGDSFCEPCVGEGYLASSLVIQGFDCVYAGDIESGHDAMEWTNPEQAMIVTNPPWDRLILHPLINHFVSLKQPVWLLIDADWMHTKQAVPLLYKCTHIVSIGRVKWIPGSRNTGFDNAAWYRFHFSSDNWPTFIPRS